MWDKLNIKKEEKMTITPNIFDYATSELSQDAFICYLLSFGQQSATFCITIHFELCSGVQLNYLEIV